MEKVKNLKYEINRLAKTINAAKGFSKKQKVYIDVRYDKIIFILNAIEFEGKNPLSNSIFIYFLYGEEKLFMPISISKKLTEFEKIKFIDSTLEYYFNFNI